MSRMRWTVIVTLICLVMPFYCCGCCGFGKYMCKSKQSEAREGLKFLQLTMQSIKVETNEYPETIDELAGKSEFATYYEYKLISVDSDSFVIEAHGKGDMEGDVLSIDQDGIFKPINDKCK